MDKYTRFFIVVCVVILAAVGFILLKGFGVFCLYMYKPETILLNTQNMRRSDYSITDSTVSLNFIRSYPFGGQADKQSSANIGTCDTYLCEVRYNGLEKRSDTVIVLDVELGNKVPGNPENYGVEVKVATVLQGCFVSVPKTLRDSIKHYGYQYGHLIFVTDD